MPSDPRTLKSQAFDEIICVVEETRLQQTEIGDIIAKYKIAFAEYNRYRKLAQAKKLAKLPPDYHGKASTYNTYACRCIPCRTAKSVEHQTYRKRKH